MALASAGAAQPEAEDDSEGPGDFTIDDSAFGGSESFSREEDGGALEHFTFRISQQSVGHLNRHGIEHPDGETGHQAHGLENNRLSVNLEYQNPIASGWLLQAGARHRFYLPGDYEYRVNDDLEQETWLNELFIQRSGESHSLTLGRQTVVWGETLANSVLDIVNTSEFRDLTVIDLEDARRNQWMLSWDWFTDAGTWSSFVNLYPEFDPLPVQGSPLFPDLPWRLSHFHRDEAMLEAGTRWSRSFSGSDVSVMAAYLYENQLHFLPPESGQRSAQPQVNDFLLLGFSANRAIGSLLLTLDVAFSDDVLADSLTAGPALPVPRPGLVGKDRLGASLGLEYAMSNTEQFSFSVAAQRLLRTENNPPGETLTERDDITGNALMRYSNNMLNDELLLSATLQSNLDADLALLSLAADYQLNDRWSLTGELILTHASAEQALYSLDEDVRAGLTLSLEL